MESYKKMWNEAFNTSGRTRRKDYWIAMGINILIILICSFCIISFDPEIVKAAIIILAIYSLAILVPSTTMAIRRLHDSGKPGWIYLVYLVLNIVARNAEITILSTIISIAWLVLACLDSTEDNQWGPNPKKEETF